jgi:hypothetical protein
MPGVRRLGDEAIVVQQRQCKTCMVKARLLEPQSARLMVKLRRRIAETPHREEDGDCQSNHPIWRSSRETDRHPAYPASPTMRWGNRTNREPNHVVSLLHRKCGIAYTGSHYELPAGRRSPHSTQGWPVIGTAGDQETWLHRQGYKRWVTTRESPTTGGKGDSLHRFQYLRKRGCADAAR